MATQQLAKTVPTIHELATIEERYRALVAQRETIARTLMPANASAVQVDAFLRLCARYALDPFVGEAWAYPKPGGGIGFMPGYRAYLRLAQEHPDFELLRFGVVFRGEECKVNPASGEVHHVMGFEDSEPIAAWWQLKRRGQPPMAGRVLLKHVMRNTSAWKESPVQMLRKAAIVEACMVGMGLAANPAYVRLEESDDDILDVAGLDVDESTGEILDTPGGVNAAIDNANHVAETPLEPEAAEAPPASSGADDATVGPASEAPAATRLGPHAFAFSAEQTDTMRLRLKQLHDFDAERYLQQAWANGLSEDDALHGLAVIVREASAQ